MDHPTHARPVVAGVDGSPASRRAVHAAAAEARLRKAPLHLVTALPWPFSDLVTPPPPGTDLRTRLHGRAEAVLEEVAGEVAGSEQVTWSVVEGGPADVLHGLSAGAQLLVLGSRGLGGVAGLLVGSTATAVVGAADCPVLVLPDDTAVTVSRRRSVVVAVEGRPGDEDVLDVAFAQAAARGTDLVAVHAWQEVTLEAAPGSADPLLDWGNVREEAARVLAEALAGWREKQPDVDVCEVVVRDKPAHALLAAALTAELLVIGHRHRHRLAGFGSTTHGVLHRARCPLVVVPLDTSPER